MAATIHFRRNANAMTGCGKNSVNIPVNINWNLINCTECLMLKAYLKSRRS